MPNIEDVLRRQQEIIDTVGWAVMHVQPTADPRGRFPWEDGYGTDPHAQPLIAHP